MEEPRRKDDLQSVLKAIDSEVDRQLVDHARSAGALTNRAALLVTSALIFVSISKEGNGAEGWYQAALVLGAIAAVVGAVALFYRPSLNEVTASRLEAQLVGKSQIEAIRMLTDAKQTTLKNGRKNIGVIAGIVMGGFFCLALSVICTVIYLWEG